MKPNQPETNELLKKLAESASWWRRFFESSDAEEIHQIISEVSPLDLATLDQRVRESWTTYRYYNLQHWKNLRPSDVGRLAQSPFATSIVGLASSHFSGYVREAAVVELASHNTGKELPFLLIRLNDWVSQVREVAEKAVRARIEPAYAVHFLTNISLVLRLRGCGRVDKKFVQDICDLLRRAECRDVLLGGIKSKDKTVRRNSFQLAAEAEPSSRTVIIHTALADPDVVTRSWAVRHFLRDVSPDELPGIVEQMFKDSFMPVRRDALWFAATKRPDIAKEPLCDALLDNHLSMRETARQFLDLAEVKSVREFYVDVVKSGNEKQLFAAICGLGETGTATDVPFVLQFLDSPLTRVRRAAVYATGKLDLGGQLERLVAFLSDPRPSVSREALKALLPRARQITVTDLESLLSGSEFHVRRNALVLISHTGKWKKIPALLKACADKDERIVKYANGALRAWTTNYNASYEEPTNGDFQRITVALTQFEPYLPQEFGAEMRVCLKIYFK